ncbi:single-stranded DNA-binding protein [Arthrobacter wenxiniae]|uniref:Single-stranded DNA-binding protein n=1 Tax=Arthrobacter wenxiniae TaxID=2713570 RepID=A0A7Y7LZB6_9MICC|nr:single-stranded DNA-binding protein [Arthrobacter wenxiniae]NVM94481.1 single-stranded DNA-binding protein [Arthrobacter wenxiniae]
MSNYLTIRGFASSPVELDTKESGLVIGKFRMGSNDRVLDPATNEWGDGPTNWYRINTFRTLATNVAASIKKGDRIIVTGKLKINNFTKLDGTQGMSVEIDADSVGADLKFGSCTYHRSSAQRPGSQSQQGQYDAGAPAPGTLANAGVGTAHSVSDPDGDDGDPGEGDDQAAAAALAEGGSASSAGDTPDAEGDDGTEDGETLNQETGELVKTGPPF